MRAHQPYDVYILTKKSDTLYIGITNDILRRITEHKQKLVKGFTQRYNIHRLIYTETYPTALEAIEREKQLKKWSRVKKIARIKQTNPGLKN